MLFYIYLGRIDFSMLIDFDKFPSVAPIQFLRDSILSLDMKIDHTE